MGLRVLFLVRSDLKKNPAGDTVQILKTGEALTRLGIEVKKTSDPHQDYSLYDLVHIFNLCRVEDNQAFLPYIPSSRPLVLSPIYWNMEKYLGQEKPELLSWWEKSNAGRRQLLEAADLLLPNARGELKLLAEDFGPQLKDKRTVIVYNAADAIFQQAEPVEFITRYGQRDFILSVGRICKRKNQLSLIRALSNSSRPLIIIGHVNEPLYYRQCQAEASPSTIFIPHLPPEELAAAYAAARVHVLASWFDTPGLVSLEAALAGCRIVTSCYGTAREYFGTSAHYCRPDSIHSINRAVIKALKAPADRQLALKVSGKYSWSVVAAETLKAYRWLLDEDLQE